MKKLSAFLALVLGILPVVVSADTCQHTATTSGNTLNQGAVEASNLNPAFTGYFPPMSFQALETSNFVFTILTNLSLLGALVNPGINSSGYAAIPISGFSIQCAPYNATLATAGGAGYPYNVETTGIGGGTVTFTEFKPTTGAGVVVGTLVLPPSPHGGPYINYATSTLTTPYIPTLGSTIDARVTALSGSVASATQYADCTTTAVLS